MTRLVFRDERGRFTTKNKAHEIQEVEGRTWKPIKRFIDEDKEEQLEEYEYFVGVDNDSGKKRHEKGKDFHTEFKVTSPVSLSETEIRDLIIAEKPDFRNVLQADGTEFTLRDWTKRNVKEPAELEVKFTKKITRR